MNLEQLKTILWLRWRLTRNQWARSGGLGAIIAVIVTAGAFGLAAMSFVGGLLGAALGLGTATPLAILAVWFGITVAFLFFWMIGLLVELQRSETIDLQRLMHLPVALGQMFFVNYVVSHFTLSIVLALPAMLGLALGLAYARGLLMLLLVPLAVGTVFMITAWTYCLRGWLATLMSNPRRRRTIIMCITFAFVLLGQAPNIFFNILRPDHSTGKSTTREERQQRRAARKAAERETLEKLIAAQKFIPPLWLPVGAQALAEGRALPAVAGMLGCLAIGAMGLRRAYRNTIRFYHGETGSKRSTIVQPAQAGALASVPARAGLRLLEIGLPGVPEQAAALALATFRSMLRAPEVKMAWATSFFITVIVGASIFLRAAPKLPENAKPFVVTGTMVFSIFTLVQFLANQFGFDREGFRALVLAPANRRWVLLGKNLATLPIGAVSGGILLVLCTLWLRLPLLTGVAALFQLVTILLLASMGGNLLSILVPYRIAAGSMKPAKVPAVPMLVMALCHIFFPIVMAPVFVPPLAELLWQMAGWPHQAPVNLLLSVVLAGLTACGYFLMLEPMGRLLQRREIKVLSMVTVEVE